MTIVPCRKQRRQTIPALVSTAGRVVGACRSSAVVSWVFDVISIVSIPGVQVHAVMLKRDCFGLTRTRIRYYGSI